MEMIVRRAKVALAFIGQRLIYNNAAVVPAAHHHRTRAHAEVMQRILEAEAVENPRCVRTDLDACANLAQFSGLLKNLDLEAGASQRQCGGEATDTASDDNNSHLHDRLRPHCTLASGRCAIFVISGFATPAFSASARSGSDE